MVFYTDVVGYQRFGGPRYFHLQGENHNTLSQYRRPRLEACIQFRTESVYVCVCVCMCVCMYVYSKVSPVLN